MAHFEGLQIVKHTHGELGIAAAAVHQLLLTIPNLIDGNQQTAHMMSDDILKETIPPTFQPNWNAPPGTGTCVAVDEDKVAHYHELYRERGQFLPYDPDLMGTDMG